MRADNVVTAKIYSGDVIALAEVVRDLQAVLLHTMSAPKRLADFDQQNRKGRLMDFADLLRNRLKSETRPKAAI